MFDLGQIRCFVAVAEELHFGRAAERLHMTQPPVSRQIRLLEETLGVRLMERTNRVVALTAAGRSFLADARRILRLCEEARLSVRRVAGGEKGALTVGFIPASGYGLLPRIVARARAEMPDVDLILKELVTDQQLQGLATRGLDVGILRPPVDRDRMETVCVARDHMVLAMPESHRLVSCERVALLELDRQPFVMYAPVEGRYHHDLVSAALRQAGILPDCVQYARETHTMLALVGAGVGLAVVPESATRLRPDGVTIRPLAVDAPIVSRTLLAWLRRNDDPALASFRAMMLRMTMEP